MNNVTGALCALLCASFLSSATVAEPSTQYDYPLKDRFVSTVVGTPTEFKAALPEGNPLSPSTIEIFPERETPDVLFYNSKLRYSHALQGEAAPLVFLIAGTGASHDGGKNTSMARAFFHAGYHVISISSPTYNNFMVSASKRGVPGHHLHDAEDLYRVMEKIVAKHGDDITVTDYYVTGYSLGGFNTAFVTHLDETRQVFNFRKALLINPPVSLYNSISLLDRMSENIPGGEDNFGLFFNQLMAGVGEIYKRQDDSLDLNEDLLYKAYQALGLKDEQLAALIGVAFRLSSATLIFTSDVMTDYGFIKPSNLELPRTADLSRYRMVSSRLGFTDYYHDFFYPFFREETPDMSRDDFIREVSLNSIRDYLQSNPKIEVMHNRDDVILATGEIDFFSEVFGERAKIYPVGGHCGNMDHRDNVAHMLSVFADDA